MTRKPYQTRPATPDDIDLLKRLYRASRDRELAAMPWSPAMKDAFITQQFELRQRDYGLTYAKAEDKIIMLENAPVGRILIDRSDAVWVLVDIVLLGAAQGQGIGADLLTSLIEEAAQADKALELHVEPHNPALRLYQRLGFKPVDQTQTHIRMRITANGVQK